MAKVDIRKDAERDRRLAEALRANLRRRKEQGRAAKNKADDAGPEVP